MVVTAAEARAAGPVDAARTAYDRGAAFYDAAEFPAAAAELARADELTANDIALALAIKAATKADNPALAMGLAARAEGRPSPQLNEIRELTLAKMSNRVGTLKLSCATHDCTATLDGSPVSAEAARYVNPGEHTVSIMSGGRTITYRRSFAAGAIVPLGAPAPAALTPTLPDEKRASAGVSGAWFWIGAGLTTVIGGATLASALDTRAKQEAFRVNRSESLALDGEAAQWRTNALAVGLLVSAAISTVVGIFVLSSSGAQGTTIPAQAMRR